MTLTEQILARVSGHDTVRPGEYITVSPDLLIIHEFFIYPQTVNAMKELDIDRIWNPDRVMVVFDHGSPAVSKKWATKLKKGREFVRQQGITNFFDVGHGISHQIAAELGFIRPGMFVTNGDPHVTAYGAFGTFAPAIGSQTQLELVLTGETWMQVPETIRFVLEGELPAGTTARDIFMGIMNEIGLDGALEMTMEFVGPAVAHLDVDQRMTLCDLAPLAGATNAIIEPDDVTNSYLSERVSEPWTPVQSNGVQATQAITVSLSELEPLVNVPPDPVTAYPVTEIESRHVDQGFLGSCAGGRMDEFRLAAQILDGRHIHAGTRLIVTPASKEIYHRMIADGTAEIFLNAGATIESPGCGVCMGFKGALADGEVSIANSTQNMQGRMGSPTAEIYLANAAVVAASCVEGHIVDPRPYLTEAGV